MKSSPTKKKNVNLKINLNNVKKSRPQEGYQSQQSSGRENYYRTNQVNRDITRLAAGQFTHRSKDKEELVVDEAGVLEKEGSFRRNMSNRGRMFDHLIQPSGLSIDEHDDMPLRRRKAKSGNRNRPMRPISGGP